MSFPPQGLDKADVLTNQATIETNEATIIVNQAVILADIEQHDKHFHTLQRWFGKSADQSGNNWATEAGFTTFQATSGAGDFGTAIKILGSDDTPNRVGKTQFDIHTVFIQSTQAATYYLLRFIWGTGSDPDVEEAAGRFSDVAYMREAANGRGAPLEHRMVRLAAGTKIWVKSKNALVRTIDIYVALHEYD